MTIFQLSASFAALSLATAAFAAPVPSATERAAAQTRLHPIVAREAEPGDDGGQRRRHGGRAIEETPASTIIAREDETETEDESGDDGHQRRGGRG